ncbi:MAG TPA: hypothetical protein VIE44_07400 [Methylomirabilota bacterium]
MLGHLDDLVVTPLGVLLMWRLISASVWADCPARVELLPAQFRAMPLILVLLQDGLLLPREPVEAQHLGTGILGVRRSRVSDMSGRRARSAPERAARRR